MFTGNITLRHVFTVLSKQALSLEEGKIYIEELENDFIVNEDIISIF